MPASVLPSVVLPQPELPDDAERLPGAHIEGDVVESLDGAATQTEHIAHREMPAELADLQQGLARAHLTASVRDGWGWKQRTLWRAPLTGGRAELQAALALLQRG